MARVMPSQVLSLIDQVFPIAKNGTSFSFDKTYQSSLSAIINLIDQIPHELINLDTHNYTNLIVGITAIKEALAEWKNRNFPVNKVSGYTSDLNPIHLIRSSLALCPDEFPSPLTTQLSFIQDGVFRENLCIDISTANLALSNGEFKAATVLAGSVIEALLLWVLQQKDPRDIKTAVSALVATQVLKSKPPGNLEEWNLHQLIEVAKKLNIIEEETAIEARLTKNFRNLIHPGRSMRLSQTCDRGTALLTVATIEHVVRDLEKQYSP